MIETEFDKPDFRDQPIGDLADRIGIFSKQRQRQEEQRQRQEEQVSVAKVSFEQFNKQIEKAAKFPPIEAFNEQRKAFNELRKYNPLSYETEQHKTETGNPQEDQMKLHVDKEKLKEYFTPDIFQKKGTQKSKVDKFIELLGTGGSLKRVAQFALFAYNHLLRDRYKHSLSWEKWLSIFYEITQKTGYKYRQKEVSNPELETQIKALFNHK